jgi:uncharacterized transporter YbjL
MINTISYNTNNGGKLELVQRFHDDNVLIINKDSKDNHESIPDNEAFISAGDMVMLINYYRYVKQNNIQCDFINPNGKNPRP